MLEAPLWAIEEANFLFFKFLWDGKPDKIKRSVMVRRTELGGLKMIDVDAMAKALKAKLITKMYENSSLKWCNVVSAYFTKLPLSEFLLSSIDMDAVPPGLPNYY